MAPNWVWLHARALAILVWRLLAPRLRGIPHIVDGDSLVLNGHRCRLAGVDAPEYNQTSTRNGNKRHLGAQARNALTDLIAGRPVVCKVLGQDVYDRKLVICYNHEGKDVSRALVRMGLAQIHVFRGRPQARRYLVDQFRAKLARRGLWETKGNSPQAWRNAGN